MQFGKGMKVMRALRGVSQAELALRVGVSFPYINRAESGRINLKREQEDRIRLELCWPKEIDHLLDKIEGFRYEQ